MSDPCQRLLWSPRRIALRWRSHYAVGSSVQKKVIELFFCSSEKYVAMLLFFFREGGDRRTWFARAFSPGQGPRRSPGPGGTYSWPLPALTSMYCAFASKMGIGSNTDVAALALPCLACIAFATSCSARFSTSGSWPAASSIAVGHAAVNDAVAAATSAIFTFRKYMVEI